LPQLGTGLVTHEQKSYNIFVAYLMSVPLHRQLEVMDAYENFQTQRSQAISWMKKIFHERRLTDVKKTYGYYERIGIIIEHAMHEASSSMQKGTNINHEGRRVGFKALTCTNIRSLVMKEKGTSLYRIVKSINKMEV
jgi:hypothetical protein